MPSNFQVFFNPQRISNHFGSDKTNIKNVKNVPINERLSLFTPNKRIGVAKSQPNKYKKGINIIEEINFGLNKNSLMYKFFNLLKIIFISKYLYC